MTYIHQICGRADLMHKKQSDILSKTSMRYLLKISGEALQNGKQVGTDHAYVMELWARICRLVEAGHQIAIVNGGGNIARWEEFAQHGISENTAHGIGMLATVINATVLQDAIVRCGCKCNLYTARNIDTVGEVFNSRKATADLESWKVVIIAGGTGNPYFTTDTASALRSVELGCDMMVKCTNVDGLYDKDPKKNPDAKKYTHVWYEEVIQKNLRVMDQTAIALAKDQHLKVAICHIDSLDQLKKFDEKNFVGTIVS